MAISVAVVIVVVEVVETLVAVRVVITVAVRWLGADHEPQREPTAVNEARAVERAVVVGARAVAVIAATAVTVIDARTILRHVGSAAAVAPAGARAIGPASIR